MTTHGHSSPAAAAPAVASLVLLLLLSMAAPSEAMLKFDYYNTSCPQLEQIVSEIATNKQITTPTTAAGALRLFFHDCFVSGCDASVLISSNSFTHAERDADINLSLPGDAFDAVVRAKAALELQCPGVVSCADILTLATRDFVNLLGGPFYPVKMGRKDSLTSTVGKVHGNLPEAGTPMDQMIHIFAGKGFTAQDMVALSGAHTVGFSHCSEFASRIFNFNGGGPEAFDPSMNPRYAKALQKACAGYRKDPNIAAFNDLMTPGKFDNMYFRNLGRGLGLLASDQVLLADPRTRPFVEVYAGNQTAFFEDFGRAMQKLSEYKVKSGKDGEVRRRCDQFNSIGQ